MASILLIDDDRLRDSLGCDLMTLGHTVESLGCAEEGLARLANA